MDHAYIDEHQVAERYLLGQLPPAEAALFEEHSMVCPECRERLETAEKLRLGLRAVAARDATAEVVKLSLLARIVRSRLAPAGLLVLFLAALLPSGLLWRRIGRLEGELAASRAVQRRSPEPAPRPTADPGERERLAAELEKARAPRVNVPIVSLSPERSGPGGAPSTRLSLPPSTEWVVLSLELAAVEHPSYRATLIGPDHRTVWQGSDLRPDAQDTLTIAFPAARLQDGDFTVRVEALPTRGEPVPVADYTFRLTRAS
jgi:Putative zinc-finger